MRKWTIKTQRLYWVHNDGKQNKKQKTEIILGTERMRAKQKTEIILGTERRQEKQKTQQKIKQLSNIYISLKAYWCETKYIFNVTGHTDNVLQAEIK